MLVHNTCIKSNSNSLQSTTGKGNNNEKLKINTITPVINAEDLEMTQTVLNHSYDIVKKGKHKGELSRPYINSNGTTLLVDEIMKATTPQKDISLSNGLRWDSPGTFRGREGTWELVVDLDTNKIVHFNFVN